MVVSRFHAFVAKYTLLVRCVALFLLCVTVYLGVYCLKFSSSPHSERNALKRKNHRVSEEKSSIFQNYHLCSLLAPMKP